ncbi:MAG TPA: Ada metal-binding domain-containing protein [Candidatus Saccharimonadales bacterium]
MKVQKHIQFDERFSSINGRQKNKNSTFLYGVISTGIFCLPHCPSKIPSPENVVYFENASQALNQGFRSCKRCKPNLSLNLAVEDEHEKILQLAKKQIINNDCKKVGDLAKILNISERQLHRIIKAKTGEGTLAFIKSNS